MDSFVVLTPYVYRQIFIVTVIMIVRMKVTKRTVLQLLVLIINFYVLVVEQTVPQNAFLKLSFVMENVIVKMIVMRKQLAVRNYKLY